MNPRVEARFVFLAVGVLTLIVAVMTREGGLRRGAAFLAAWLVPGAGHAFLGRWKKGLFFFAALGLTALLGFWITGFRPVSWDDNPFYYVGQYGSGLMMLLSKVISREKAFPRPDLPLSWFDPGLLYVCVAGLLNAVVAMNVLEIRPKSAPAEGVPVPPPAEAAPGEGKP
jgi:hypothetical protein